MGNRTLCYVRCLLCRGVSTRKIVCFFFVSARTIFCKQSSSVRWSFLSFPRDLQDLKDTHTTHDASIPVQNYYSVQGLLVLSP